jgi:hypothetical protein
MKITGHRTETSFLKYIKVSKLDAAKRLSKHMQLKWSEKLLKGLDLGLLVEKYTRQLHGK